MVVPVLVDYSRDGVNWGHGVEYEMEHLSDEPEDPSPYLFVRHTVFGSFDVAVGASVVADARPLAMVRVRDGERKLCQDHRGGLRYVPLGATHLRIRTGDVVETFPLALEEYLDRHRIRSGRVSLAGSRYWREVQFWLRDGHPGHSLNYLIPLDDTDLEQFEKDGEWYI